MTPHSLLREWAAPALLMLGLLAAWEVACRLFRVPAFILPPPSAVAAALWEMREPLFRVHLPVTALEVAVGFVASAVVGVALTAAMRLSPHLARALYPLVVASQTIPVIATSPVFLLWFGYTLTQKVAVTVLISFFTVTVNTYDGLRSADPDLVDLLRAAGATRWQIFTRAEVPSALPLFFSGLKVAAAVSVIGATIGEWLGGEAGLGVFGRRMVSTLRAAPLFASVFLLSLLGIGFFLLIAWVERRAIPWHFREVQGRRSA